jgi:anti-sigma factor RsiW
MKLDDDTLSAYLDGELPADKMTAVAQALSHDAEARARFQAFQRVQALVGEADLLGKHGDAPARIAVAIRAAPLGQARGWLDGARGAFAGLLAMPRPALAAFATVVLAVGLVAFVAGRLLSPATTLLDEANDISPGGPLHAALERLPSAEGLDLANAHITLIATFRTGDGRYCREYDYGAARPGTVSVTGLACRTTSGAWRVEFAVLTQSEAGTTGYAPASDDAHRAVAAFISARTQGAALGASEEAQAIAQGWE